MSINEIEILKRALNREREAKEIAEKFVEQRIFNLYTENVSLNKKFKSQSEFQRILIDNLVDALFVIDFKGNILQSNKEARKLIGLKSFENFPNSIVIIFDCFRNNELLHNGNLKSFGHYQNLIGFNGDVICGDINNKSDLELLDIYKDKRVELYDRLVFFNIIKQSKEKNIDFYVLSHHQDNPLNFLHLETLYLGYPLIHNCGCYKKAGYFYKDIKQGSEKLFDAINNHKNIIEDYNKESEKVLFKYSPNNPNNINNYKILLENITSKKTYEEVPLIKNITGKKKYEGNVSY